MSVLHSPEAELELLGALMNANGLIDPISEIVAPEDFCDPLMGRVFTAILREAQAGKVATPVTIRAYFEDDPAMLELGGTVVLMQMMTKAVGIGTKDIARQIADLALRRRMQDGLTAAAASCSDPEATIPEIVSFADGAISNLGKDQIHQPTGADCFDELIDGFDEGDYGVTCGKVPNLDSLLGPLRPGQLVINAARPGMGKTALALSYALGAAEKGHGVLFISLEMSSRELAGRMAADLCYDRFKIPYNLIRDGKVEHWQRQKIAAAGSYMRGLPFQVVDTGSLTVGRLNMLVRRHARRMAANGQKLELVVVDYLQLLSPDNRGRSSYEAISEISKSLKAMAKDQGVAIMALAQLSREVEKRPDKRPQLSDLRDSGQIEQDADAVLFLLRKEYYLRQDEPDALDAKRAAWEVALDIERGRIEFILAKRRNGETGKEVGEFHGVFQAVR